MGCFSMIDRNRFVERAKDNIGVKAGDKYHKQIVDGYNRKNPKPMGYTVTYQDDWCDVFVTWCADKENVSDLVGRECGVQRHKKIFQKKGIWIGRKRPQMGDIIVYDWQGYHANWADHIGIVERVNGDMVVVIEGNTGSPRQVKRRTIKWNNNVVVGYARPKWRDSGTSLLVDYDKLVRETWQGKYGNGEERKKRLGKHYEEVMKRINKK